MNRWVWFCLLTGLCLADFSQADTIQISTPGRMKVSGEIIESTCAIDNEKNYQPAESVLDKKELITNNKNILSAQALHIHLIDCSLRSKVSPAIYYHNAEITFVSEGVSNHNKVGNTDNKALGISLEPKYGTLVEFGKSSPDYQFIDEDNNINLQLLLVSKENRSQESLFHATLRIYMAYI